MFERRSIVDSLLWEEVDIIEEKASEEEVAHASEVNRELIGEGRVGFLDFAELVVFEGISVLLDVLEHLHVGLDTLPVLVPALLTHA